MAWATSPKFGWEDARHPEFTARCPALAWIPALGSDVLAGPASVEDEWDLLSAGLTHVFAIFVADLG